MGRGDVRIDSGFDRPGLFVLPDGGQLRIYDPSSPTTYGPPQHTPAGTSGKPIVLDLNSDGELGLTSTSEKVLFDSDEDGFRELQAWIGEDDTSGVVEDGFLVADLNADGIVQGNELAFANRTEADDTDVQALAALYDSNDDGKINQLDHDFASLAVWIDEDRDGVTDQGELVALSDAGISEITTSPGEDGYRSISQLSESEKAALGVIESNIGTTEIGDTIIDAEFLSGGA